MQKPELEAFKSRLIRSLIDAGRVHFSLNDVADALSAGNSDAAICIMDELEKGNSSVGLNEICGGSHLLNYARDPRVRLNFVMGVLKNRLIRMMKRSIGSFLWL